MARIITEQQASRAVLPLMKYAQSAAGWVAFLSAVLVGVAIAQILDDSVSTLMHIIDWAGGAFLAFLSVRSIANCSQIGMVVREVEKRSRI